MLGGKLRDWRATRDGKLFSMNSTKIASIVVSFGNRIQKIQRKSVCYNERLSYASNVAHDGIYACLLHIRMLAVHRLLRVIQLSYDFWRNKKKKKWWMHLSTVGKKWYVRFHRSIAFDKSPCSPIVSVRWVTWWNVFYTNFWVSFLVLRGGLPGGREKV